MDTTRLRKKAQDHRQRPISPHGELSRKAQLDTSRTQAEKHRDKIKRKNARAYTAARAAGLCVKCQVRPIGADRLAQGLNTCGCRSDTGQPDLRRAVAGRKGQLAPGTTAEKRRRSMLKAQVKTMARDALLPIGPEIDNPLATHFRDQAGRCNECQQALVEGATNRLLALDDDALDRTLADYRGRADTGLIQLDEVVARARGGALHYGNQQLLHVQCNNAKSDRITEATRRIMAERGIRFDDKGEPVWPEWIASTLTWPSPETT